MVKQYFVPTSIFSQVIEVDAASGVGVAPATEGEYRAIAGVLAAGTLTVSSPSANQLTYTPDGTADFTSRWVAATVSYTAGPPPYNSLVPAGSNQRKFMSLDQIDAVDLSSVQDVDALMEFEVADVTLAVAGFVLRGSGSAGSENGYTLRVMYNAAASQNELRMAKYVSGSNSNLAGNEIAASLTAATRYRLRANATGSAIRVKLWEASLAEPASWTYEVTDTSIAAAGRLGLFGFNANATSRIYHIGIGLNGEAAPVPV